MTSPDCKISAIVLAAGLSTRMGQPKMVMPWGKTTVIGQVVSSLSSAGIEPVIVVTGRAKGEVEEALQGSGALFALNPNYANGEMLCSIQTGIQVLPPIIDAFLLVLGDQPQIEIAVIQQLITQYIKKRSPLVVPSYQMHRGHPWLVDHSLWGELIRMKPPETMRDFLNRHPQEIDYVNVDSDSILRDLDTPEDYRRYAPDQQG